MTWKMVTGGARRLGAHLAVSLAKAGSNVLIHYDTSEAEARQVAERCMQYGVKSAVVRGNFGTQSGIENFITEVSENYGDIGSLINNVGPYLVKTATQTTVGELEYLYQLNVNAPFALIRGFLPTIKAARGCVINMGTVGLGSARANVQRAGYFSAKMALWTLTKSLAREVVADDVRVNMVSPGYLENSVDLPMDPNVLPIGRPAKLEEVARVIVFLLDRDSAYITGQNIEVGGGVNL